ncbi:hypothetical protein DYB32_001025 [Aphanomyces invadans]|uniref:LNR domain-containing protein n=1 Tax=Aphanomyces invadans TaxID=157072 RepID=A0A418B821_9STRA|nr:hypothetical protein DYB32_001025 [Aphanomyces invadans]
MFTRVKHVVCGVYFAMLAFVFFKLSPSSAAAIHAYAPLVTACTYTALTLLHVGFVVRSCRRPPPPSSPSPPAATALKRRLTSFINKDELLSEANEWWWCNLSEDKHILVFHTVEVVCQSYKAFQVTQYVVDKWFVGAFLSCVALNLVVSPWFFVGRRSSATNHIILSWFNSFIGFYLSCLLPLASLLAPVLKLLLVDWTLSSNHAWYTRVLLYCRIVVASSPLDYVVKLVMDVNTLVSLYRLAGALPPRSLQASTWSSRKKQPSRLLIERRTTTEKNTTAFKRRHHRRPPFVVWYAVCSVGCGVTVWVLCLQALFFRQPCPSTCQAATTPLLDLTCHCKYLHINCHVLRNQSLDIDAFIDPHDVGSSVFVLKVSRCDVRSGISNSTFAHQQSLNTVVFQFTKLRDWDAALPATLTSIQFRQCDFFSVPVSLQAKLPPLLTNLMFESTPLATLPEHLVDIWQPVTNLFFFNTSLTTTPTALSTLGNLQALYLTNHPWLTTVDDLWQAQLNHLPQLHSVNLGGNSLTELPTTLRSDIMLDVSSNPIAVLPRGFDTARLTSKMVLVGNTTYCNSSTDATVCGRAICAPGCMLWAVGDQLCDLACFTAACEYDRGDCDEYGLSPP